jgi:hypothetical protein
MFAKLEQGMLRQLPRPAPGQPGLFSLGGDEVLRGALARTGFQDIHAVMSIGREPIALNHSYLNATVGSTLAACRAGV